MNALKKELGSVLEKNRALAEEVNEKKEVISLNVNYVIEVKPCAVTKTLTCIKKLDRNMLAASFTLIVSFPLPVKRG